MLKRRTTRASLYNKITSPSDSGPSVKVVEASQARRCNERAEGSGDTNDYEQSGFIETRSRLMKPVHVRFTIDL